jgi:hypothetical protein
VATAAIDPIEVGICRDIIASPQATRFYCNASQLWALWGFSTARKSYLLSDLTVGSCSVLPRLRCSLSKAHDITAHA